jgi:ankyrin repeat protein
MCGRAGERLNCAVPTKAELERDRKKKKTTTSRNHKKKKASRKPTIKGADPNATDAHGNTALHAFAALGLRQVVVALLLSGADVLARNDERRLGLSLLPDDELVALEKNAARLPAGSATRHLLQALLQQHHTTAQLQ